MDGRREAQFLVSGAKTGLPDESQALLCAAERVDWLKAPAIPYCCRNDAARTQLGHCAAVTADEGTWFAPPPVLRSGSRCQVRFLPAHPASIGHVVLPGQGFTNWDAQLS